MGPSLWRHLSRAGDRGGLGPAPLQHRGDADPSRGDLPGGRARAHAILILDRAGWHTTPKLKLPENITLLPLPARAPELNPAENVWRFLRQNWLSNRVFKSYDDIVDHCCYAWNQLADQPWIIMSIGLRDWAQVGQTQ